MNCSSALPFGRLVIKCFNIWIFLVNIIWIFSSKNSVWYCPEVKCSGALAFGRMVIKYFNFFRKKIVNILFTRVYNIVKWTAVVRWHLGEWWISREIPIYALCPWLHHHPPWHTSKRTDIVKIITSRILARTFDAQPVLQCTLYGWAAAH